MSDPAPAAGATSTRRAGRCVTPRLLYFELRLAVRLVIMSEYWLPFIYSVAFSAFSIALLAFTIAHRLRLRRIILGILHPSPKPDQSGEAETAQVKDGMATHHLTYV